MGDHLLCCGCGGEVIRRHNPLVWVIRQINQQAGIRSSSTFRTIHNPNPQDSKNQVDFALFQPNFDPGYAGCTYLYDTTVIHQPSLTSRLTSIMPITRSSTLLNRNETSIKQKLKRKVRKLFHLPSPPLEMPMKMSFA
jgi:hypothetical protein